jgi:oligopeptide transport system permease protein
MEQQEVVKGASLWKDAWKRLLKNKLSVFGLVVMVIMIIAVIIGPAIIKWTTGYTADFIPPDGNLIKSFPPSLQHPMGTDDSGRDILARVLQGGRISLMVGIISTIVSLIVGVSYGATAGYLGGRIDNFMRRLVGYYLRDSIYLNRHRSAVGFRRTEHARLDSIISGSLGGGQGLSQIILLFFALGLVSWLTMARVVRGQILSLKNQEFVLAARATGGFDAPRLSFVI